jgi:hypothetical protein
MNSPDLLAEARYTPLLDIASAVVGPEQASSVNVADLDQLLRDIIASSELNL